MKGSTIFVVTKEGEREVLGLGLAISPRGVISKPGGKSGRS